MRVLLHYRIEEVNCITEVKKQYDNLCPENPCMYNRGSYNFV